MDLLAHMRSLGIVGADEPETLRTVEGLARATPEPRALAKQLLQREILTPFQANQIFTGKAATLSVGRYLVLDRLGEGGMGKVYKARDRKLHRVVALKVIHPERLANRTAVDRFLREIQAVAKLSHPNIVWAFDADAAGDMHYFAMQFVPGIDLAKLVRQNGPLDVIHACDYMRQAARGLQHIADHGMVHRDIKPSNLLIVTDKQASGKGASGKGESGVLTKVKTHLVKIVDLGLTRLSLDTNNAESALTQSGTMMGTPDYMAPEQARNSHATDIRGDIYSLGCTLFFALIGRPPFGGVTYVQKIMHHQLDPVEAVDQLRPGIPPTLTAVIQRMMAKNPEERYQSPAIVAQVLEPFTLGSVVPVALPVGEVPAPAQAAKPTEPMFQFADTHVDRVVVTSRPAPKPKGYWDQWLWAWIAGGGGAGILILFLLLRLIFKK